MGVARSHYSGLGFDVETLNPKHPMQEKETAQMLSGQARVVKFLYKVHRLGVLFNVLLMWSLRKS